MMKRVKFFFNVTVRYYIIYHLIPEKDRSVLSTACWSYSALTTTAPKDKYKEERKILALYCFLFKNSKK